MITPAQLFLCGTPIEDRHKMLSKYTYYAKTYNPPHLRIITLGGILEKGYKKGEDLPAYVFDFIGVHGEVIMMANIVERQVLSINLRTIRGEKAFSVFGSQTKAFYGMGMISPDFKYNDWVMLVEGNLDCEVGRAIYPNTMACMTAGLTTMQLETLKLMTRRVILAYDNDKAGRLGYKRDSKKLKELGFEVKCLIQYEDFKDLGDLMDLKYSGDDFNFNVAYKYYYNKITGMTKERDFTSL